MSNEMMKREMQEAVQAGEAGGFRTPLTSSRE